MSAHEVREWLARLHEPRTMTSLIMEVYGQTAWWGCMFELQIADLLNWYCRTETGEEPRFRTREGDEGEGMHQAGGIIAEIRKRKFLKDDELGFLVDGKDARDELIHRIVERKEIITQSDEERLLAEIIELRRRIIIGYQFAKERKVFYAKKVQAQLGLPGDFFDRIIKQQKSESEAAESSVNEALKVLGD
jgi:hypothetical protein